MELGEFTEEIIRYSFLLGSALRNEDEEQFVEIYDTIVPKTLTRDQIESIKDSARAISELDEEEYNELVVRARDFSLAQSSWAQTMINNNEALHPASSAASSVTVDSSASDLKYMDMDDEAAPHKPSMESLARTSRHFSSTGSAGTKSGDFDPVEDADSGIFNSSKNTAGSISDHDLTDTCESRVGVFDYYSQEGDSLQRCASTSSLDQDRRAASWAAHRTDREQERLNEQAYDAAFDADTDIDSQIQQADRAASCREEIEMQTFKPKYYTLEGVEKNEKKINDFIRQQNNETYDEAHSYDSDNSCEDLQSVVVDPTGTSGPWNMHKSLYGRPDIYTRIDNDMEYHEDDSQFGSNPPHKNNVNKFGSSSGPGESKQLFFPSKSNYSATRSYGTYASSRSVDSRVTFPLGGSSANRNTSSDGVKIDKSVKSRDIVPPFPTKNKLINSIGTLIDNHHSYKSETIRNMPPAEIISHNTMANSRESSLEDPDTSKKDKKKKKKKKDKEHGEEEDENGNPILQDRYVDAPVKPWSSFQSKFPQDLNHLTSYTKDSSDDIMPSALDTQQSKKMRRRKRKEDTAVKAQTLPGNIGHKDLDELLSFIDGPNNVADNNHHKKVAPTNNHRHDGHDKTVLVSTASVILENKAEDVVKTPVPDNNNKAKKKKKTKNGIKSTSSEVDDKSSRTSDADLDKLKDAFGEGSDPVFSKDVADQYQQIHNDNSLLADENAALLLNDFTSKEYIFTDFDSTIQKEEQFTVVGKKKKKPGAIVPKDFSSRDYYIPDTRKEEVPFRRRSRPHQRSFTPPPNASSSAIQDKSSERSLSPSAFPVLSNSRDARRNSTGNVSELGFNYDSDMDSSVKSVPVIGSASNTTDISTTSGSKPSCISYATITAGGKTGQNGPGHQEEETLVGGQSAKDSVDICAETSPEERRSRKLSSDNCNNCVDVVLEDNNKPASSSSSTVVCAIAELSQSSSTSPVAPSINATIKDSTADVQPDCSVARTLETSVARPEVSLNVNDSADFPALPQASLVHPPSQKSPKLAADTTTTTTLINSTLPTQPVSSLVSVSSAGKVDNNVQHPAKVPAQSHAAPASSKPPVRPTVATTQAHKGGVSAKPPQAPPRFIATTSKSKNKAAGGAKSVVFLDKRMNDGPKNLGISFGYEPDLENVIISARLESSSTCSSDSGRGTDNDSFVPINVVDNKEKSYVDSTSPVIVEEDVAPATSSKYKLAGLHNGGNNIHNSELVFMSDQTDLSKKDEDVQKLKLVAPLLNGVVQPAETPREEVKDEQESSVDTAADLSQTQQDSVACPSDSPAPEPSSTTDQQPSTVSMYQRADDPNFLCGQFNHEAGVAFLYTDWQKSNPAATVYAEA